MRKVCHSLRVQLAKPNQYITLTDTGGRREVNLLPAARVYLVTVCG